MSARLLVARGRVLLALCRPALLLLFGLVVSVGVARAAVMASRRSTASRWRSDTTLVGK